MTENTIRKWRIIWLDKNDSDVAHGEVIAMNEQDAVAKAGKLKMPMPHIVNFEVKEKINYCKE